MLTTYNYVNGQFVQILLLVVPAHGIKGIFDLEYHRAERAHGRKIGTSLDLFVIGVIDEMISVCGGG